MAIHDLSDLPEEEEAACLLVVRLLFAWQGKGGGLAIERQVAIVVSLRERRRHRLAKLRSVRRARSCPGRDRAEAGRQAMTCPGSMRSAADRW